MLRTSTALALLFSAACATAPPSPARSWPAAVMEAACRLPKIQSLAQDAPVWVSLRTRRIHKFGSLFLKTSGRTLSLESLNGIAVVEAAADNTFSPTVLPASACRSLRLEEAPPPELTGSLELSGLLQNPFSNPPSMGVFARVSLGRSMGASWFWLELSSDARGGWSVTKVLQLDVQDG